MSEVKRWFRNHDAVSAGTISSYTGLGNFVGIWSSCSKYISLIKWVRALIDFSMSCTCWLSNEGSSARIWDETNLIREFGVACIELQNVDATMIVRRTCPLFRDPNRHRSDFARVIA